MSRELRRVAVIGGMRIPFCRSNTLYADLSNLDMMTAALNGLVDRFGLKGQHIDEVVGGAVVTHSKDFNLAREAVLSTKLAPSTPGVTLIQACGTSLQGGADVGRQDRDAARSNARSPSAPTRRRTRRSCFRRSFPSAWSRSASRRRRSTRSRCSRVSRRRNLRRSRRSSSEPRTGLSMGQHCELMAQEWKIARADQDKLAFESHKKGAAAYD